MANYYAFSSGARQLVVLSSALRLRYGGCLKFGSVCLDRRLMSYLRRLSHTRFVDAFSCSNEFSYLSDILWMNPRLLRARASTFYLCWLPVHTSLKHWIHVLKKLSCYIVIFCLFSKHSYHETHVSIRRSVGKRVHGESRRWVTENIWWVFSLFLFLLMICKRRKSFSSSPPRTRFRFRVLWMFWQQRRPRPGRSWGSVTWRFVLKPCRACRKTICSLWKFEGKGEQKILHLFFFLSPFIRRPF